MFLRAMPLVRFLVRLCGVGLASSGRRILPARSVCGVPNSRQIWNAACISAFAKIHTISSSGSDVARGRSVKPFRVIHAHLARSALSQELKLTKYAQCNINVLYAKTIPATAEIPANLEGTPLSELP